MGKIRQNFIYNIVLNISTYIASLITFPYISRILNADLLGTISFVNQAVQYFTLFSLAGIVAVGTRAIAECGKDREKRSVVYSSLLSLSLVTTIVILIIYFPCVWFIPAFNKYQNLFIIGSAQILFSSLLIEWLFRGVEDFKFIAIRNIAIRIIYIILLFILVKKPDDYIVYFELTIGVIVVNALVNLNYSRKFVHFIFSIPTYLREWKKMIKSFLVIGGNNIMNSFYSTFNVIYLGIICTKDEVGYYYISNKIMTICLGVITAFTLTMLPRMSNLIGSNNKDEFNRILNKSFAVVIKICIPLCVLLFLYSTEIVNIISGKGYQQAIIPLKIISPVIFINAIAQIIVFQVQMPLHKERAILNATILAALVGVLMNIILVGRLGVIGSSIVLLSSVLVNLIYNIYYIQKYDLFKFPFAQVLRVLIESLPYVLLYIALKEILNNNLLIFILGGTLSVAYWILINKKILVEILRIKKVNG